MKLRELHEAATPAPWNTRPMTHHGEIGTGFSHIGSGDSSVNFDMMTSEQDAALIAYLRNHAPDIIRLIEAAEKIETKGRLGFINDRLFNEFSQALHPFRSEAKSDR